MKSITEISRCRHALGAVFPIVLFLALATGLWSQEKAAAPDIEWELKIEKEDIRLYSRWVPVSADRKTRELRGVLSVEASIEEVLQLLRFEGNTRPWLDHCQHAYTFDEQADRQQWFSYAYFALPWPISDQDIVLYNTLSVKESGRFIHIDMKSVENIKAVPKNVNRIQAFTGSWRLKALPNGQTQIDYRVQTRNKPTIPTWITDPVVQQSFLRTLGNLRKAVETTNQKIAQKN